MISGWELPVYLIVDRTPDEGAEILIPHSLFPSERPAILPKARAAPFSKAKGAAVPI